METLDTALKARTRGNMVSPRCTRPTATQTVSRVISFFRPHQHDEIRHLLSTAPAGDRLIAPGAAQDGRGRSRRPSADQLRPRWPTTSVICPSSQLPDLIAQGSVQYGMQSFDQSLSLYQQGVISYESAIFYASNPSEFALKVSGRRFIGESAGWIRPPGRSS